jgi:transposase
VAGGVSAAALVGYALWKRLRRRNANRNDGDPTKRPQSFEAAVALYRALETALRIHGLPRPPSRPPLRHAEELQELRHPLAGEVLALTTVYLEARFGGQALTEAGQRDFERRIREIRAFRV